MKTQRANVVILQLPDRFRQLFFYVGVLVVVLVIYIIAAMFLFFKDYVKICLYL